MLILLTLQLHVLRHSEKKDQYIEDIQMFLLNMAFISSSEVENIYIYIHIFHFTSEIKAIINKKSFECSFYYIQPYQPRGTCTLHFFQAISFSGFVP